MGSRIPPGERIIWAKVSAPTTLPYSENSCETGRVLDAQCHRNT